MPLVGFAGLGLMIICYFCFSKQTNTGKKNYKYVASHNLELVLASSKTIQVYRHFLEKFLCQILPDSLCKSVLCSQ